MGCSSSSTKGGSLAAGGVQRRRVYGTRSGIPTRKDESPVRDVHNSTTALQCRAVEYDAEDVMNPRHSMDETSPSQLESKGDRPLQPNLETTQAYIMELNDFLSAVEDFPRHFQAMVHEARAAAPNGQCSRKQRAQACKRIDNLLMTIHHGRA
mmetsp:Transcript_53927/g.128457  ORF Transcript_53927/g.128457 Transcript_53927/m.128457 type:complete len:153 (+) Transcript_53927:130-588(+)